MQMYNVTDGWTETNDGIASMNIESLLFNCNVQHSHDAQLGRQTDSRIVLQSANLLIRLS